MGKVLVFDCNETLIDLESLNPVFERILGSKEGMRVWFANMILYSCALTLSESYVPFTEIGGSVMEMLAKARGKKITTEDREELAERFASMPVHPEVPNALKRLKTAGFRLFTLTDTPAATNGKQLERAGILDLFERRFSVDDTVKRHKPAREAYDHVIQTLGVKPSEVTMIACHIWDTMGAVAVGWDAAFIARKENAVLGVGPQATYVGRDLNEIADQLIARNR